jgi:sugar/nucleoside kinase (ribokinase family)
VLCCIGDLVEDVVVWLTSDIAVGTDTGVTIHRRRGGSAANVAVAAASQGVRTRFVGRVGSDAVGVALVDDLRSAGVDARVQIGGRTGTIVVLVDPTGERTMLPDRGASVDLDAISRDDLADVSWLHVPAYSLVVGRLAATTQEAISLVRDRGGSISVDASSVALIDELGLDPFRDLLERVRPDVLFCNRDEAERLQVGPARGVAGSAVTVVKAGPDPVELYSAGREIATIPVTDPGPVRDTTGAGDAFAAGFITSRMEGEDLTAAAVSGHRLAAEILAQHSS